MMSLALRSVAWTIALPGIVVGVIPWRYLGLASASADWHQPWSWIGATLIGAGVLLLLTCVVSFARSGRGTLSPLDPPRTLVATGMYRYVRNPMYLGTVTVLIGETLLAKSGALLSYTAIWFVWVNLFVLGYEEPVLRRQFGIAYEEYCQQISRWMPHRPRPGA